MAVSTKIEIEASPEEVRSILLDFEHWSEINDPMVRSVARLPSHPDGPIQQGEKLLCNFAGMTSEAIVLENTPQAFSWRGNLFYILSGEHTFRFEPSKVTPGGTTFVNMEVPHRFNVLLFKLLPMEKDLQGFCERFKERVNKVKKGKADEGLA